jgi:hypothetical protein
MDFSFAAGDDAFRDELRGWLASQLPPFLEHWTRDEGVPVAHGFNRSQQRRRDSHAGS